MLFRPQRGSLRDAMGEVREVATRAELAAHLHATEDQIELLPYCFDGRIDWDTYLVIVHYEGGRHVAGFLNGPMKAKE